MGLSQAAAQPVGASVIAGQAQILSSGATTVVNQNTSKAIINWKDFSVGAGASVQFNQPTSSSITLNRVTGSNLSTIDGAIRANGQVWLLNPNGVLFGNNARVNVGGLLATTSDIANQDFIEGRYNFSGGKNAVTNKGSITASSGGSVILSAPNVANHGLISANAGHVVLGGTDTFTVDFNGDRLLSYAVGPSAQTGSVTNTGKIQAQGGQILMTARAASGVQDAVINNSGMVEATSARSVNGEIVLDAGEGTATNSGTLDASGRAAGETGGTAKVLGRVAAVSDNAVIDVSGSTGGGTVLIGGNYQGRGTEQHAQTTIVGKASIKANAIDAGNGGKVVVWSDGTTSFAGAIEARGGAKGGNGGQVETSGHDLQVADGATVVTHAPLGVNGNWLLDPKFIIINSSGGASASGQTFAFDASGSYTISPTTIDTALGGGNVTLQANTDITISSAAIFTNGQPNILELDAGRSILVNADLTYAGGSLILSAKNPGADPAWRDTGAASISQTSGTGISAARLDLILTSNGLDGGSIGTAASPILVTGATPTYIKTLNADAWLATPVGGAFHFVVGNSAHAVGADLGTGSLNLVVNGAQQQAPLSVNNLTVSQQTGITSGNPVNFSSSFSNVVNGTVTFNNSAAFPAAVSFVNTVSTTLGASTVSGDMTLSSMGAAADFTVAGAVADTGNLYLASGRDLFVGANITTSGAPSVLKLQAQRAIQMTNATVALQSSHVDLISFSDGTAGGAIGGDPASAGIPIAIANGSPTYVKTAGANAFLTVPSGATYGINLGDGTATFPYAVDLGNFARTTVGHLYLNANGVTQSLKIGVNNLTIGRPSGVTVGSAIDLSNPGNTITGILNINAQGRNTTTTPYVNVVTSSTMTVGGVNLGRNTAGDTGPAGTVSVQVQGGDLTLTGNINTESQVTLSASGNLTDPIAAIINAPVVSLNSSFGSIGTGASPLKLAGGSAGTLVLEASASTAGSAFISSSATGSVGLGIVGSSTFGLKGGSVSLNTVSGIFENTNGPIAVGSLSITATTGSVNLGVANNAVGALSVSAGNNFVNLYNSGNLTINKISGATSVNIQTSGTLALATPASGATITSTGATLLHAGGAITHGTGVGIVASAVGLVSDAGAIGTASNPIVMNTNGLSARTAGKDMYFSVSKLGTNNTLTTGTLTSSATGQIAATAIAGVNAGTGNVVLNADTMAVINGSNTQTGIVSSITAANLQILTGSLNLQGAAVTSLSANVSGTLTINNNGSFEIRNLNGGAGLQSGGIVNLNAATGSITQGAGASGAITVGSGFTASTTGAPGNIILTNGLNAIGGAVNLVGLGNIAFTNATSTTLNRVAGNGTSQGATAAQLVDIEVLGAGNTLTIGGSGIVVNGNTVTLHSTGSILEASSNGAVAGSNVSLISDTGSIGAFSASGGQVPLRGVSTLATRARGDIFLINSPTVVSNVAVVTPITIGTVANLGPAGGTVSGITAGGTVGLAFGSFDVRGLGTIKADALYISGNSIKLDDILVNSLGAFSQAGDIDITSSGSFNINNGVSINANPGIQTTGIVSLSSTGTITQSSGARGMISAGALSVFGTGGVTLDNSANAITGIIQLGSLGNALLVNSLASHLNIGIAGGTLTLVSGGDLELVAGPSIATLADGQAVTLNSGTVLSAALLSQIGGIVISLKTSGDGVVLSTPGKFVNNFGAGALVLPGGSRFLVYSADPAADTFGGLKTSDAGIFGASYPTAVTATGNRYIFAVASSSNTDFLIPAATVPTTPTTVPTTPVVTVPTTPVVTDGTPPNTNTNTNTNTGTAGLTTNTNTAAAPALVGFVSGAQPPPHNPPPPPPPARADVLQIAGLPPTPPPPPPPRTSPLADLAGPGGGNAEPPSSSDQATSYVASSLEGGPPPVVGGSGGGTVIPRYLTSQPNPPTGTLQDPSVLPGFGNLSLWQ